ncbi:MAG TPA: TraB/GumN family protein [Chitinophagaceae bacterium]|nr:TraB/GumN family protein [Chitinophagaceae bacterium]
MKRYFILVAITLFYYCAQSQGPAKAKTKKYPSLFWEISGNGLERPSYLFGTMHVSSKIAFNLADSFYLAIKNSEVVALETNPETWQEDMNNYDLGSSNYKYGVNPGVMNDMPNDFLSIKTLRFGKYEKKLEVAMFSKPSMINNLLYRSMSDNNSDFEEDTYLDLYIYQTGKKLGKKVAGVEQYEQSMKLMAEAFRDAAKEKNKKEKSFDYDEEFSPAKLQEAYRAGNLDQLDSINKLNSQSDAFDEKFLYRRNEIQANSIDSILKRSSLFVGVGAAHLPGNRGVIELLRRKGYKLRPIYMGTRDSRQKDAVERVRVPVTFSTQTADDGFYKVDIPGKFYRFGENFLFDQQQYADMANGSFYMVTRVKTNSLYWGHNADVVAKKIDSLLYENVPGKILNKTEITKNGYKGYDITSRTRRGDYNRYNIFITPFEVIFFKMGGNGEYVRNGDEAKKFFNSIQLREFKNVGWKKFQPAYGGFSVEFPQQPYESFGDNVQYDAEEKSTGEHFSVIRTDIHNYRFVGEDTFDLALMDESFGSADYIEKNIARKQLVFKGYPALDCQYKHKDGSTIFARFLIQGPHYYTLVAHGKKINPATERFFNSFELVPFVYKEMKERKDTAMYFSVKTPWFPEDKKNKVDVPSEDSYMSDEDDDDNYFSLAKDDYKTRLVKNDTTGEAVYISFSRTSKYEYVDSTLRRDNKYLFMPGFDTTWIVRSAKKSTLPNGMKVMEQVVSDTNSSRAIVTKTFYKEGLYFQLTTQTDTLSQPSNFVKSFFDNFIPADTLKIISPFTKKSKVFFDDFFGKDSVARKKAINSVWEIDMDSTDLPLLTKAINSFKWSEKKYLERKISFINKLGDIPVKASADLLKDIYYAAGDTVQLQHTALSGLLSQKTQYSFNLFKDIITNEPPVLDTENSYQSNYRTYSYPNIYTNSGFSGGTFLKGLYDSLQLTKKILPDLLPLMTLDDYKKPIMRLLRKMVDSNLVKAKDYEIYYSKFLIEAKQQLKKQAIEEKKSAIEKAEGEKTEAKTADLYRRNQGDQGNEDLMTYATLLLPFSETNPAVKEVLKQMLSSNDKRLKYNTVYLFLRHKISLPDTMLTYFAKLDDFRYELFTDMRTLKILDKFPVEYKSQQALSKSKLFSSSYYGKPDSLVFIDSLPASLKNSKGFVFFYKYKAKKDDLFWKLATAGLMSKNNDPFNYDDDDEEDDDDNDYDTGYTSIMSGWNFSRDENKVVFTEFTDEKIKEDVPLKEQMEKQLKKVLFSKRKSARMFYNEGPDYSDRPFRYID